MAAAKLLAPNVSLHRRKRNVTGKESIALYVAFGDNTSLYCIKVELQMSPRQILVQTVATCLVNQSEQDIFWLCSEMRWSWSGPSRLVR